MQIKLAVFNRIEAKLLLGAMLMFSFISGAQACSSVKEPDGQAYCQAMQRGDTGYCMQIKDETLRALCKMRLGEKTACIEISDRVKRGKCEAESQLVQY